MLKQLVIFLSIVSFACSLALAQDKPETEGKNKKECPTGSQSCCGKKESHSEANMEKNDQTEVVQIWNKVCPVKGEEVDLEAGSVEYNGKIYGFCCPGCNSKFKKDPEKYSKSLNEDGTEFIGG